MVPMHGKIHKLKAAGAAAIIIAATSLPQTTRAGGVTSEQVRASIQRGVARLRQSQLADGTWRDQGHKGGIMAVNR